MSRFRHAKHATGPSDATCDTLDAQQVSGRGRGWHTGRRPPTAPFTNTSSSSHLQNCCNLPAVPLITLVLLAAKISFNADKASCDITFIFTLQHSGITSKHISPIADFLATWDATPVEPSPSKSPFNQRFSQRLLGSAHILPSADPQTPTRSKSCNGNKQN